jgi:hypothetical protein
MHVCASSRGSCGSRRAAYNAADATRQLGAAADTVGVRECTSAPAAATAAQKRRAAYNAAGAPGASGVWQQAQLRPCGQLQPASTGFSTTSRWPTAAAICAALPVLGSARCTSAPAAAAAAEAEKCSDQLWVRQQPCVRVCEMHICASSCGSSERRRAEEKSADEDGGLQCWEPIAADATSH